MSQCEQVPWGEADAEGGDAEGGDAEGGDAEGGDAGGRLMTEAYDCNEFAGTSSARRGCCGLSAPVVLNITQMLQHELLNATISEGKRVKASQDDDVIVSMDKNGIARWKHHCRV